MATIDLIIEDEVRTLWKNTWDDWQERHKNSLVKDVFPKYDGFDEFIDDYASKTRAIIEEVIARNELNGDFNVEFTVKDYRKISAYAANFCLAQYLLAESNDSKAVFSINYYHLFSQIYRRSTWAGSCDAVIEHEFRHHIDRKFIQYSHEARKGKRKFNEKKNEAGERVPASVNLANYFLTYLFKTRTEGFAAFDRTFATFDRIFNEEEFAVSPERFFRQSLARNTDTLMQVLNFCNNQKTMTYEKFSRHIGIIEEAPGRNCPGSDLSTEEVFSPYAQGPLLFKIIALAEMKKRAKQTQRAVRLDDLLSENEIPEDIHKGVSKKVLGLKTLGSFFNLFYDSARELRLKPDELIVPKVYTEKYAAGK